MDAAGAGEGGSCSRGRLGRRLQRRPAREAAATGAGEEDDCSEGRRLGTLFFSVHDSTLHIFLTRIARRQKFPAGNNSSHALARACAPKFPAHFRTAPVRFRAASAPQRAIAMKNWGTSANKQKELTKLLDEWAVYIRRKYGNKQLSSSTYLSEAEPFLEQYAKRSPANQALIGAAGDLVQTENFLAVLEAARDEEGDLQPEHGTTPPSPTSTSLDVVLKTEGLIVFFPGIPGCAKSALCKEILNTPGGLGDNRPLHTLMGDLIKGRYWQRVADERKKKPFRITLADKNAPNEEVWRQIEDMCTTTKAAAVPVFLILKKKLKTRGASKNYSLGKRSLFCTDSNPFSLEALAVFMFRVVSTGQSSDITKCWLCLLMFYNLYDGKNRREFESELYERFGSLVKMPLLKPDRAPLPDEVKVILDEGLSLFRLHQSRHGRADPSKGAYANEWAQWRKIAPNLFANTDYLNSIQCCKKSSLRPPRRLCGSAPHQYLLVCH
ncbi:hypothetical protein GUJ93_ZPchr0007g3918 [Zizania palustris]|uniref:Uncharacterized protein n=1 Tax=Zizania palustris TaxID=103762 RepID=A0A8J5VU97_ZIZPA|nr:hypothetical protein GUJ93_ZPchr0007g3918 [Zizania palustris]